MDSKAPIKGRKRRELVKAAGKEALPERMEILLHVPVTLKDPKKRRHQLSVLPSSTIGPEDGGFAVVLSHDTRREQPWYVAPDYENLGLPAHRWFSLEDENKITIGRW